MDSDSDPLSPVELLLEEFLDRQQRGEKPTVGEYCERHPEMADEIRHVFEAVAMVEGLKPGSGDVTDKPPSPTRNLAPKILRQVGDYRILREVGRGGMGVVYEAEQESLGRRVALKVLPRSAAGDHKSLLRFQREARAAARMHHTNIVPVFEVGEDDEVVFYAMQLIQGQGLDLVIDDLRNLRSEFIERSDGKHRSARGLNDRNSTDRAADGLAASLMTGRFDHESLAGSDGDQETPAHRDRPSAKQSVDEQPAGSAAADSAAPELEETVAAPSGSSVSATLPGQSEISTAESNRGAYFRSVADIGLQTSRAIGYAHARGIIHRDIKPSNLLLDSTGVVWVTDFGLAKTSDSAMTHTGDILGTIRYMSPERFKGQCDVRTDIYALGLTLYELLTLKPAFVSSDRAGLMEQVVHSSPPTPRTVDPRVPRDLETIVLKSIDKEPRRRYQSADELEDDLRRFLSDEPILARRISSGERLVRWSRRNPWLSAAVSVAAIALIAVAGLSLLFARQQSIAATEQRDLMAAQARLNQELEESNQRLGDSNQQLAKSKTQREDALKQLQEQHKTLQTSQAHLAYRHGLFELERGATPDGLLWLSRSLELMPDSNAKLFNEVRARIRAEAGDFPRLQSIVGTPPFRPLDDPGDSRGPVFLRKMIFERLKEQRLSPDAGYLARLTPTNLGSGSARRRLSVWKLAPDEALDLPVPSECQETQAVAFSSDSHLLAAVTSGNENTSSRLVIWNVSSGRLVTAPIDTGIQTTTRLPVAVRFSPGNEQIFLFAVGSETRSATENHNRGLIGWPFVIGRWDVSTGKLVSRTSSQSFKSSDSNSKSPGFVTPSSSSVVVSPDTSSSLVFNGAFNPNGLFRIDHQSRDIQILEVAETSEVNISRIVPISPDGRRVAIATKRDNSIGSRVEVWDFESGTRVGESLAHDGWSISTINASQDGTTLLVSGRVTSRSEQARHLAAPMQSSQGDRSELTGRVQVWDLASQTPLCPLLMTDQVANATMLGIDNQVLTIASERMVKTWKIPATRLRRRIIPAPRSWSRTPPLRALAEFGRSGLNVRTLGSGIGFSDAGELVTTSCVDDDFRIRYWDASSARFLRETRIDVSETDNGFFGVDPRNGLLARMYIKPRYQTATRIQCFQARTGKEIGMPILSQHFTVPLAFDRRGSRLLAVEIPSGRADRRPRFIERPRIPLAEQVPNAGRPEQPRWRLSVWEIESGKRLERDCIVGSGVEFGQFVGENQIVFATEKREIFSWDLQSPRPTSVMTISGFQGPDPDHFGAFGRAVGGFSRDGRWGAVTTDPMTVQVFDLENGVTVGSPMRHPQAVSDIAFDSAGATVAVAMKSGQVWQWTTARQWPRDPDQIAARLESHLGQRLDEKGHRTILDALPNSANDLPNEYEERGHFTRSELQVLDSLLSESGASGDGLDAWLSQKPNDSLANLLKMKELVAEQQFDQAHQFLKRSLIQNDQTTIGQWLKSEFESTEHVLYRSETDEARDAWRAKTQWYLDQTIALLPKDNELKRARVESSFSAGEFRTALAGVLELQELERTEFWHSYLHAILLLRLGRLEDCRNACAELLSEYGQSSDRVSRLHAAQLYLLLMPEGDDFELVTRLVDQEVEDLRASLSEYKRETHLLVMLTQAIAELRRGNYDMTREILEQKLGEKPHLGDRNGLSSLLYAICELRSGRPLSAGEITATAQVQLEELIDWEGERPGSANGHDLESLGLEPEFGSISTQIQVYRTLFGLILQEIGDGVDLDLAAKYNSVKETARKHLSQSLAEKAADEIAKLIALAPGEPQLAKDFHLLTGSGCGGVSPTQLQQLVISKLPQELQDVWQSHVIASPNTTDWLVLFEDRFERSEVGTDWTPHDGDWDIDKGQLVGTLTGRAFRSYRSAYVSLNGQCLPTQFEVEYDTWWTDDGASEVKVFFRDRSSDGFIAGLCGLRHPTRPHYDPDYDSGYGPHLYDSYDEKFHPESKVPQFELQSGQRYCVRVTRNERHVVVYVDDQELMTASIESAFAPVLMLYGFGTPDSTVGFDNLVIRIPPNNYVSEAGQGSRQYVDLSQHFNQRLDEGFHGSTNNAGLSGLAQGIQKLGGVEFMVGDGCLQLARIPHKPATARSGDDRIDLHWTGSDSRIDGIQLNKEFDSLHLLHALGWGDLEPPETQVAEIVLHYADGKTATLPLKIGVHARNWWSRTSTYPCSKAVVAWNAEIPEKANVNVTLYRTTLANPRPNVVVTKIDYVSSMTKVAPFCVAMTVEK